MLTVKTPEETQKLITEAFAGFRTDCEEIPLAAAWGRILVKPQAAHEYIPGFNRSTVDGYALHAADTFGCSLSSPAMLHFIGEVEMGEAVGLTIAAGECVYVPTGGELPDGADAMVMLEYAEDYQDGFIYINKPAAPGQNIIFKGDDTSPGKELLAPGTKLTAAAMGALAAIGVAKVPVFSRPRVGIISTGDELIPVENTPVYSQIRDSNSYALIGGITAAGGEAVCYGIVKDDFDTLLTVVKEALDDCDMLLISGGSSVGFRDATLKVIDALEDSQILLHGIAVKPGKPTILASVGGKPVFGLPGHPVSAYFIFSVFAMPLIGMMMSYTAPSYGIMAHLSEAIPSNHGRAEYIAVYLSRQNGVWTAQPVRGKSGLITTLTKANGYICIPRDCEGRACDQEVRVFLF